MNFEFENRIPRDRIDRDTLRLILAMEDENGTASGFDCGCTSSKGHTSQNIRGSSARHGAESSVARNASAGTCGCGNQDDNGNSVTLPPLHGYPLAMVYSPYQDFRDLYEADAALARGTLFRELDKPFLAGSAACMGSRGGCGCD